MKVQSQIKKKQVAHLTNDFATKAQIGFNSSRQLCLFLLLVSQTDPFDEEEKMSGIISLQDISRLIRKENAKRSGSVNQEVLEFVENMMRNNFIKFQSEISFKGKKLPDYIVIFERLKPIELEGSSATFYEYKFSEEMRPHLKGFLRDFVSLSIPRGIKSGHAVRFLIMAKAHHDRRKSYMSTTSLEVEIETLKKVLGIEGKYSIFANFKERVLNPIIDGVNNSKILEIVEHKFIKTGRKITHIEFFIQDGILSKAQNSKAIDFVPSEEDEAKLTFSQKKAYDFLCSMFCKPGIAYRQIIEKMPSSEYIGWEDIFIKEAWMKFDKRTKYKDSKAKMGAFVKWWVKGEFKDRLFSEIMEIVQLKKKATTKEGLVNRDLAKNMAHKEFEEWYHQTVKKDITKANESELLFEDIHFNVQQPNRGLIDYKKWKIENANIYEEIASKQLAELDTLLGDKANSLDRTTKIKMISSTIEAKILKYIEANK